MPSNARSALPNIPNFARNDAQIYTLSYALQYALDVMKFEKTREPPPLAETFNSANKHYINPNPLEELKTMGCAIEYLDSNISVENISNTLNANGVSIIFSYVHSRDRTTSYPGYFAVTTKINELFLLREISQRWVGSAEIKRLLHLPENITRNDGSPRYMNIYPESSIL